MCNRYTLAAQEEARQALQAIIQTPFNPSGQTVHPQGRGVVVRRLQGARVMSAMTWGFPLILRGKQGQPLKPKPVNNARTDKLDSGFWRRWTGPEHRCLIPLTAWAEAQGPKGRMTETWLSLPGEPVIAAAGLWRPSDEWGDCYTMVMTDSAGDAASVHSRMPVLLAEADRDTWLNTPLDDAMALCRPWLGPMTVERTDTPWSAYRL